MTICKGWFSFSVSVALLACRVGGASEFAFDLTPSIIEPGQRAILELRLKRGDVEQSAVLQDVLLTKNNSIKILESDYDDSGEILIWRYQMTSYLPGAFNVPPVELKYGPATYSTESVTLTVVSGRSPQDTALRAPFGKVSLPINWDKWFPWLALALGLMVGYPLFRRFVQPAIGRFLADPGLGIFLSAPSESPQQWLARQLRRIRSNMEKSRGKEYWLDDLTDVLREFFSRQYGRPTRSWTLKEMSEQMGTIPAVRDVIAEVIARSDKLRFSGDPEQTNVETVRSLLEQSEKALLKCGS